MIEPIASELISRADLALQVSEFLKAEPFCDLVTKCSKDTTLPWKAAGPLEEQDFTEVSRLH